MKEKLLVVGVLAAAGTFIAGCAAIGCAIGIKLYNLSEKRKMRKMADDGK